MVIDTTISMKPYIDQSLNVVRAIFDSVAKDKLDDKVSFGIVAFRNSTKASPKLEYVTKVVSDFRDATKRDELEKALSGLEEAKASSHSFNEDSLAAVSRLKMRWRRTCLPRFMVFHPLCVCTGKLLHGSAAKRKAADLHPRP